MDAIEIFADHVVKSSYNSLSNEAIEATRIFIQDSFVQIVGSSSSS